MQFLMPHMPLIISHAKTRGSNKVRTAIRLAGIVTGLGLLCLANMAQALNCTPNLGNLSVNFPATVTVPRDAAVGSLLTGWNYSANITYNCQNADPGKWTGIGAWSTMTEATTLRTYTGSTGGTYWIFDTGLSGVGLIAAVFPNSGAGFTPVHAAYSSAVAISGTNGTAYPSLTIRVALALIKTSNFIAPGIMNAGTFGKVAGGQNNNPGGGSNYDYNLDYGAVNVGYSAVNVVPQTCTVTPPGPVNLGTLPLKTFTGIGSVAPWGRDFTISVNCSGIASKVYMVITDQQNPGNTSSTLPLTSTSAARGLGIQIWRSNGAQLSFGPDSSVAGTSNQFPVFNAPGGASAPVSLIFSSRYVQTGATVTPGTANGLATFTMSYQ